MPSPALDDEEKPLDPSVERVRAKLLRFMAINLGILFAALMIVAAALVYKMVTTEEPRPAASDIPAGAEPRTGLIALPEGAEIVSQSLDGDRVALHLRLAGGAETILLYDLANSRVIGRYAIER